MRWARQWIAWTWMLCWMWGCADLTPKTASCDAERRCETGAPNVCGDDGATYACAELAACFGVSLDPSGDACEEDCEVADPCARVRCDGNATPVQTVVDGCDACECQTIDIICPAIACDVDCEHGHVVDERGCATCECLPPPTCDPVMCTLFCEYGFRTDEQGCEICACADAPICSPLPCDIDCEFGYVLDDQGCETCKCLEAPGECGPPPRIFCENGHHVDDAGCPGGECFDACGIGPLCDLYCEGGFVRNEFGCEVCACREDCGGECFIDCEFGQIKDPNGCGTCECNNAPCLSHSECPSGSICSNPAQCKGEECFGVCVAKRACVRDTDCGSGESCVYIPHENCCPPGANCVPTCGNVCLPGERL